MLERYGAAESISERTRIDPQRRRLA
jgi:hypothetical protein